MRTRSELGLRQAAIVPILALVLAATLAACGSTINHSGATGGSANAGGCKNDLATNDGVAFARADVMAGHTRDVFAFSNDGSSPCTVEGYPTVSISGSAITVVPTTSADTWSNIAIEPITLAPNGVAYFAIQGSDDTTNCNWVSPSIAPTQGAKAKPTAITISICGDKLYVSPVVADPHVFNQ